MTPIPCRGRCAGPAALDAMSVDLHRTGADGREARQQVVEHVLSVALGAGQPDDLAAAHVEAQPVEQGAPVGAVTLTLAQRRGRRRCPGVAVESFEPIESFVISR